MLNNKNNVANEAVIADKISHFAKGGDKTARVPNIAVDNGNTIAILVSTLCIQPISLDNSVSSIDILLISDPNAIFLLSLFAVVFMLLGLQALMNLTS